MENFMKRVSLIQSELKAPKSQFNKFGGYNYRSCEDILEAAKPLCAKNGIVLTITDGIVQIGDRYYVQATATLHDTESDISLFNIAYAREAAEKKGMDESQITGTASSYARKYALNGLFCIDDTKDADTEEYRAQAEKKPADLICQQCGKKISPATIGNATYTPAIIAKQAQKKYGKNLCYDCLSELNKNGNG